MVRLGVNIDHVATVRNARGGKEPEPLTAAALAHLGGADGITVHLREDRRHIKDRDLILLKEASFIPLNLEMAASNEIVKIALAVMPNACTLVPERRQELTTEGGLDVAGNFDNIARTVHSLMSKGISVSLFIDPVEEQIVQAAKTGAAFIELHTGSYAEATGENVKQELNKLFVAAELAENNGLTVNAGHGLNYDNILPVLAIKNLHEVNIGHSIISRAIFTGLQNAVREMKNLLITGSCGTKTDDRL